MTAWLPSWWTIFLSSATMIMRELAIRHNLLAQQISSAALDQVEGFGFNLVRAVDGYVDCGVFFQGGQRNVEESGLMGRLLRLGIPIIRSPSFTRPPIAATASVAVVPEPDPMTIPSHSCVAADSAAASLEPVYVEASFEPVVVLIYGSPVEVAVSGGCFPGSRVVPAASEAMIASLATDCTASGSTS